MSKDTRFNIHDWQAKQRKQLLNEEEVTQFGQGSNIIPDKVDSQGRNTWGDKVGYAKDEIPDKDKIYDAVVHEVQSAFATYMSPDFPPFSQEYLNDPGYVVKLAKRISERAAKDIGLKEASATGTGASITTGDSMAYATPKAFKKKNKED